MPDAGEKSPTNIGTAGVGLFKSLLNSLWQFKKINAGSSNVTVTDDTGNNEVDIDVAANVAKLATAQTFTEVQTISNDAYPVFKVYRPNSTVSTVAGLSLYHNNSSAAQFQGLSIYSNLDDNTAGSEDTTLYIDLRSNGAAVTPFAITGSGLLVCGGPNRRVVISESGLTAQRIFTCPDADQKLVGETTLATLTTPTINGVREGDVGITNSDSPYTALSTKTIIRADATSGAITINLPTAASIAGTRYKIYRKDVIASTNIITIDGSGSETIDGNIVYYLFPGEWLHIESDGTNWVVIARPNPSSIGYYFLKGSTPNARYLAGYNNMNVALLTATTGPTVNTLYAMPLIVSRTTKFDLIECNVTTLGSGSNLRLGVYYDNGNNYPGKLMYDSGNISSASGGVKSATITSSLQVFQPGLYWLTYENSATVPLIRCLNIAGTCLGILGGGSTWGTTIHGFGWTVAHTVGALPDPYTAGGAQITTASAAGTPVPAVGLRPI